MGRRLASRVAVDAIDGNARGGVARVADCGGVENAGDAMLGLKIAASLIPGACARMSAVRWPCASSGGLVGHKSDRDRMVWVRVKFAESMLFEHIDSGLYVRRCAP